MGQFITIHELAKILNASPNTLKKIWRNFPYIFIGQGRTLKGARFDPDEVIEHLRKEAYHDSLSDQKKKNICCKIQVPMQTIQKRGVQEKIRCSGVGGSKAKRTEKSARVGADKFNLLSGVDNIS